MGVPYPPNAVANFFLALAQEQGRSLTPLQVMKLVYIAHGWHLGLAGQPLVSEVPQAWMYGPVFPSLYQQFKEFGNQPITRKAVELDLPSFTLREPTIGEGREVEPLKNFLRQIYGIYGKYSGGHLSTITHLPGTPWYKTWNVNGGKNKRSVPIPEKLIREHYLELKERNNRAAQVGKN